MKRLAPAALVGGLFYLAYGASSGAFLALGLVFVSLLMVITSPLVAKTSNWIDIWAKDAVGSLVVGRLARLGFQWVMNGVLLGILLATGVLTSAGLAGLGGLVWASLFATMASQGFQHVGLGFAARKIGTADLNVLLAFATALLLNAFALTGIVWLQMSLMVLAYGLTGLGFGSAIWRDFRQLSAA